MPNSKPLKAIIFDHDGTLVDSEGVHCQCWNQVIAPYKASLSYDDYCDNYNGLPTRETTRRLINRFNIPLAIEALYNAKIEALNASLAKAPFPLLPHVLDTLNWLKSRNIPMAIASGANRNEVEHSVNAHQLNAFFQNVTTKTDVTNSKPAPDVYLLAAERLGIAPEYCLAIEDSDTGEASAKNAEMLCLRLTHKPSEAHHVQNMAEAKAKIDAWLTK